MFTPQVYYGISTKLADGEQQKKQHLKPYILNRNIKIEEKDIIQLLEKRIKRTIGK